MRIWGQRSTALGWAFAVSALGAVVVVVLIVTSSVGDHEQAARSVPEPTQAAPCIGQDHAELSTAMDAQTFPVLLPRTPTIGQVEDVCRAEGGGIAIIYSSGIELREVTNDLADPLSAWKGIVERYPDAGFDVVTVRGSPALAAEASARSRGGLEWVENDVKYKITGNETTSVDDLQKIAASLS